MIHRTFFSLLIALGATTAVSAEIGRVDAATTDAAAKPATSRRTVADASLQGIGLIALLEGNVLLRYDPMHPSESTKVMISGTDAPILGIDRRPADGRLYAISERNDLFRVDADSGRLDRISSLTLGFEGTLSSGFDFNPQADRLRLVAASGQNLRVHVTLGAVATDGPLEYAAGDEHAGAQPRITAVAYTDNVPEAPITRTFDIDWKLDVLALQEPPNDGALQTIGPLGIDFDELGAFDIFTRDDGNEVAIAATAGRLYEIDLESGSARLIGPIGNGDAAVVGIALVPLVDPVP